MISSPHIDQLREICAATRVAPPNSRLDLGGLSPPSTMISGGGTHCKVEIVESTDGKQYIIKDYGSKIAQLEGALQLASSVGWDLVIPFVHLGGTKVLQELNNPLDEVLRMTLVAGETPGRVATVEECLREFFRVNVALINRGAFNWDPKLENFCLDDQGRIRLCDIAGLVKRAEVVEQIHCEIECDDDYIPYAMLKLNDRIPQVVRPIFSRLRDECGFLHGGSLAKFVLDAARKNG